MAREVHTQEGAKIFKRMIADGRAPFALLDSFMAFLASIKQVNAKTVGALDGQFVRLPGFVLPLTDNGAGAPKMAPATMSFFWPPLLAPEPKRRGRPIQWF